jgi:hypothetical protein
MVSRKTLDERLVFLNGKILCPERGLEMVKHIFLK